MDDIKRLEARWVKYRKSKRRPYYITIFLLLVLIGLLYLIDISSNAFSFLKDKNMTTSVERNISKHVVSEETNSFLSNKPILTIQNRKSTKHEAPFIPTTEERDISIAVHDVSPIEEQHTMKKVSKQNRNKKHTVVQDKKKHFKITKISSKSAYQEVERRFTQFHDVDDALFLARVYYRNGAYKKAEKWALKSNKIDNTLEESWIIFVKSKIKLGRIDEAKRILLRYIKQSNSQKAKILLYKISK